jgi:hypothetical protein
LNSADQVILVLQVILTVGPLAVYFLGLGLVSSRAYPCLVSERSDFVLLTLAFVPIISWPLVSLVTAGYYLAAALLVVVFIALFVGMLPRGRDGWVIYNVSLAELRRTLQRACGRLGWSIEFVPGSEPSEAVILPNGLTITVSEMPWLRTTTLRYRIDDTAGVGPRRALLNALAGELRRESLLPSASGAGLVVIGAMLLGLPMWYVFRHMDAIVDVVRHIVPA